MNSRTNLAAAEGLVLDVDRPARPGLRMEVGGRGLLLLRQGDRVAFLARVAHDWYDVDYLLTGDYRSPIAPLRADHAARLGGSAARWAHHFASVLDGNAEGPLHTGRWVLSAEVTHLRPGPDPAQRWTQVLLPTPGGTIDWFTDNGAWQVLPLRPPAGPDHGRVKAYRKQARDGILPPVLLWWISGLDCYVLLDGHDRLAAALAENQEPPLLALLPPSREEHEQQTNAVRQYTVAADAIVRAGMPADAMATVGRQFARALRQAETPYGITRAWPLAGGTAAWLEVARSRGFS